MRKDPRGSPWLHYPGVRPEEVGRRDSLEEHELTLGLAVPGSPPLSQMRPDPPSQPLPVPREPMQGPLWGHSPTALPTANATSSQGM